MKGNFRVPVPWLGDKVFGQSADMFFDPLSIMFPAMAWSDDFSFESRQGTTAGRILDWFSNNGPGVSPFVPIIGAKLGLLDEEEWLSRTWPRSLPLGLPGQPAQMGIIAWLEGDERINIDSFLNEDEQARLLKGSGLPLAAIQRTLGMDDDQVDRYRVDRAMVDMILVELESITDQDERDELVSDYLHAMDDPASPLWKKARDFASKEYGLRSLTSWLVMPGMLYPESRYKNNLLTEARKQYAENDQLDEFYERYPEYQLRQVAVRNFDSIEERDKALHRALFNLDMGEAQAAHAISQSEYNLIMKELNNDPEFFTSKTGRMYYDIIKEEYGSRVREDQKLIDQIWGTYGYALDTPSYQRNPRERALFIMSEEYWDIDMEDFLPSGKTTDTASDEEIFAALERMGDARDEFVNKLPARRQDGNAWFKENVRYYALGASAKQKSSELADENKWDERDKLWERTRAEQDDITDHVRSMISRSEFLSWLDRNKEPPSELQALWSEATEQMSVYKAMGPNELNWPKEVRRQYWNENPLLQMFFGNEPSPWDTALPMETWELYARLMDIRTHYYDKPGFRQLDYLSTVSDELNDILVALNLPPVEVDRTPNGKWDLRMPGIGIPTLEEFEYTLR
jgi:hypothetical protein